jgi:hypothetical protein
VDLDTIADELYALPLGEFTTSRNARAKSLRSEGRRDLADDVARLEKPSMSAWLVNQLARERSGELTPLIELGEELRAAAAELSGEELRALTRQRHQVVHALVQQARQLAHAHGQRVSDTVADEVRQTLEASLADPGVAEAVTSGRLTRAAAYAGFGEPSGLAWHRPARRTERRPSQDGRQAQVTDLASRRRRQAEQALARADERLATAQAAHDAERSRTDDAVGACEHAEGDLRRLRDELSEAEQRVNTTADAERTARQSLSRAVRVLQEAERAQRQAADDLARLR